MLFPLVVVRGRRFVAHLSAIVLLFLIMPPVLPDSGRSTLFTVELCLSLCAFFVIVTSAGDLLACVLSAGCRARSAICCALVCNRAAFSDYASSAARLCRSTLLTVALCFSLCVCFCHRVFCG